MVSVCKFVNLVTIIHLSLSAYTWLYIIFLYSYFTFVLVAGQTLSLLFTGTGVFTILLENHSGHNISITLASGVYFVLSITCGSCMALQKDFVKKLKANWWKFLFLGIVNVEGVYLQNLAYKYTTISSNTVRTNNLTIYVAS